MIKKIYLFVFSLLASITLMGQSFSYWEAAYGNGLVVPHHNSIAYHVKDYIHSADLNWVRPLYGFQPWHQAYRFPEAGFGLHTSNLGNRQLYGQAFAGYGFFSAPVIQRFHPISLHYYLAFGLSYVTKRFDLQKNPRNLAIGSHGNIFFRVAYNLHYQVSPQWMLKLGTGFTHYSNGKIEAPNKGINTLTWQLGVRYRPRIPVRKEPDEIHEVSYRNQLQISLSGGLKEWDLFDEKKYLVATGIVDYFRNYTPKLQWNLGADVFYDASLGPLAELTGKEHVNQSYLYRLGVHAGHGWQAGKASYGLQIGYYAWTRFAVRGKIYSRIFSRFQLPYGLVVGTGLKSHKAIADFIEFTLGYQFQW